MRSKFLNISGKRVLFQAPLEKILGEFCFAIGQFGRGGSPAGSLKALYSAYASHPSPFGPAVRTSVPDSVIAIVCSK